MSPPDIFDPLQAQKIQGKGKAWVSAKSHQKNLQFLQAVEFKQILDKECWLRGIGKISVQMLIQVDQYNYTGPAEEIKVLSTNNAFYDLEGISAQLAGILDEYLWSHSDNNTALSQFIGGVRQKMMDEWQTQAAQWLGDDIRADPDVLQYLKYSTNDGCKIIIGTAFRDNLFDLKIEFEDGQCYIETLASKLSDEADKQYGVMLTHEQIRRAKKAIGPPLVKIISDQRYSHPYSPDTKKKLLGMAEYIKIVAGQLEGISTLALAGAVADALDDNLDGRLSQAYDLAEKRALVYAEKHYPDINNFVSALLNTAYASCNPHVQIAGAIGIVVWDVLMTDEQKNEIIRLCTKFYKKFERSINEPIARAIAPVRDEQNDNRVELKIKSMVDLKKLNENEAANLRKELRGLIIKTTSPSQVLCYYAFGESQYSGNIIQNARRIDQLLSGHDKRPEDRACVTKWERFYYDFQ